jgi:hypothetical protein
VQPALLSGSEESSWRKGARVKRREKMAQGNGGGNEHRSPHVAAISRLMFALGRVTSTPTNPAGACAVGIAKEEGGNLRRVYVVRFRKDPMQHQCTFVRSLADVADSISNLPPKPPQACLTHNAHSTSKEVDADAGSRNRSGVRRSVIPNPFYPFPKPPEPTLRYNPCRSVISKWASALSPLCWCPNVVAN